MYIICGLGNPGKKYDHTRHNVGFDALDILAERNNISINTDKFQGLVGSGYIDGQKVLLVKPQTYMNLSGHCLRQACDFYKIDPEEELIVLCDDISLDPGKLRIRLKGSAGGHNGLKDIIAQLGTDKFTRVKIGVGAKPEGWDLADHVLGHFVGEDKIAIAESIDKASRAAAALLTEEPQKVMNQYN